MLSLSVKQAAPWILNLSDLSYPTSFQTQTVSTVADAPSGAKYRICSCQHQGNPRPSLSPELMMLDVWLEWTCRLGSMNSTNVEQELTLTGILQCEFGCRIIAFGPGRGTPCGRSLGLCG